MGASDKRPPPRSRSSLCDDPQPFVRLLLAVEPDTAVVGYKDTALMLFLLLLDCHGAGSGNESVKQS